MGWINTERREEGRKRGDRKGEMFIGRERG
jgi:hypothetical protein